MPRPRSSEPVGPNDPKRQQTAEPGRVDERLVSRVIHETTEAARAAAELADDSLEELDLDDLHHMEGPDA
ncbi:MAG: hypothetical protein H6Q90_311 [Deltaproteobacteria bacterium]|nr:hypothetical protein [Deltaproteobacteria bacterium]